MVKIAIGFVAFAAIALFALSRGGEGVSMSGETHGSEVTAPAK